MDQQANVRFSIIVAAFNIEGWIQRALKSVEEQTFKNYELIVVNDGSQDKTEEKILEICDLYDNIKYIKHEQNKKPGTARNTALREATGEYILYLDGDDYLASPDVLEKLPEIPVYGTKLTLEMVKADMDKKLLERVNYFIINTFFY